MVVSFLLKGRRAGVLIRNCFPYFQPRKAENASAAKQARRAPPLEAREAGEPSEAVGS